MTSQANIKYYSGGWLCQNKLYNVTIQFGGIWCTDIIQVWCHSHTVNVTMEHLLEHSSVISTHWWYSSSCGAPLSLVDILLSMGQHNRTLCIKCQCHNGALNCMTLVTLKWAMSHLSVLITQWCNVVAQWSTVMINGPWWSCCFVSVGTLPACTPAHSCA